MTSRDRRIVRNATLTIVALLAVSVVGGCVPYRYGQPVDSYRSQPDQHAPYGQPGNGYRSQPDQYAPYGQPGNGYRTQSYQYAPYGQPGDGYRTQSYQYAPSRNDNPPFLDGQQQRSDH
jgi:hypothetical protein